MAIEFSRDTAYWVSRWKDLELPVLGMTGQTLKALLPRAEQSRPAAMADIALRDPLFSLLALRSMNSQPRGRYGAPVLDMSNVVLLLGPRRFIEQFCDLPSLESRGARSALRDPCLYLVRQARLAAMLAAEWGRLRFDMKGEELYVAALLSPLRQWLILFDVDLQKAVMAGDGDALAQCDWLLSREALDIYAALFEQWKLPEHFIDLFMENRQHSARSHCVSLAVRLAQQLDKGWYDEGVRELLTHTASVLKVDIELLWPLVRNILLKEARHHPVPHILPLASLLPLVPPSPPEAAAEDAHPVAEHSLPAKGVLTVRAMPADVPFKRVLAVALHVLQQNFGLIRLVLLMPEGRRLTPRQTIGDDGWKALDIPLDGQLLFARVMSKTQTLWMHKDNRQRLRPLLSPQESQLLGDESWFAASLCRPGQPLALIIAARASGASAFDTQDYLCFQQLTQELARRLG